MGIVREPAGVDLIVASGRWSDEDSAEAASCLAGYRQGRQATLSPDEIAAAVSRLPLKEWFQLIHQLTASVSDNSPGSVLRQRQRKREKAHA